ncbi:MAG: GNAT family N-acetyltransferase [Roseovarius sp.]|nr:GNAT family N-acetyltransferase [Roseovarius sp.]
MQEPVIRQFTPKDADWVARAHGAHYRQSEGFDDTFQPLVERILQDFISTHDPMCECGLIAERDGRNLGSIFCVKLSEETAKLRLFFLVPQARGMGLGRSLLQQCMGLAQDVGYKSMQLWTHESHKAACTLYRKTGWKMVRSTPVHSFGCALVEQNWQINLDAA